MTIRETLLKERRNRHVRQALFNETIEGLRSRIFPLARLVHELALTLESPTLIDRGMERGFRFDKPELLHFCLLRGARIVSALNASIELGRRGYSQEIAVLLRTCIEYCSQVDFMLASRDANGNLSPDASAYLSSFFEDSFRTSDGKRKRLKLVQEKVHQIIGAHLDKFAETDNVKPADQLLSNVYLTFSYYVHARYPESMDLYGGCPGRFHLSGMSNTPKDGENLQILDSVITSASQCFVGMVQGLNLRGLLAPDQMLTKWYASTFAMRSGNNSSNTN